MCANVRWYLDNILWLLKLAILLEGVVPCLDVEHFLVNSCVVAVSNPL